jgi:hypothetical protein
MNKSAKTARVRAKGTNRKYLNTNQDCETLNCDGIKMYILSNTQSDPDIAPAFVHRNLCRSIESSGDSKYCMTGNSFPQTLYALKEGGAVSGYILLAFQLVHSLYWVSAVQSADEISPA